MLTSVSTLNCRKFEYFAAPSMPGPGALPESRYNSFIDAGSLLGTNQSGFCLLAESHDSQRPAAAALLTAERPFRSMLILTSQEAQCG